MTLEINSVNYGTYQIIEDSLILTSYSRLILTKISPELVLSVDKRMVLNHNGSREDRKRAFENEDYIQKGWSIKINLKVLDNL